MGRATLHTCHSPQRHRPTHTDPRTSHLAHHDSTATTIPCATHPKPPPNEPPHHPQVGVLTEAVDDVLSTQLRRAFGFDAFLVSLGMVGVVVGEV